MSKTRSGHEGPEVRRMILRSVKTVSRTLLLLALASCLPGLLASSVCAQSATRKVLVLASDDQYIPANTLINQAIRSTMKKGSPAQVSFFYEAQDSFRLNSEKYEKEFVELLVRK